MGTAMFSAIRPALFAIDAERAHGLTIEALAAWGAARTPFAAAAGDPILASRVAGLDFPGPVGLAAGVDKDARAIAAFFALGFGSVEVGTLTPLPQAGNPKPRLFRLAGDRAVVNRMGFNNGGLAAALPRIAAAKRRGPLGVNVGANKDAVDRIADYVAGVTAASARADYITINVSSPNTPGLRDLQHGRALDELLAAARRATTRPLFLKVAPDLDAVTMDAIAETAIDRKVDALIVSNTTVSRPDTLRSAHAREAGGLSGAPLAALARHRLIDFRKATGGRMPLISVGGIGDAEEAYLRIRSGASLVQLYTALAYEGPGLPARINRGLATLLRRDGFTSLAEAVGSAR